MRLELSPRSERDLEEIGDYIAKDNPGRAVSFVRELRTQCTLMVEQPNIGAPRFELHPGLRILPYGRYLILYTHDAVAVRVERVLHSARDLVAAISG